MSAEKESGPRPGQEATAQNDDLTSKSISSPAPAQGGEWRGASDARTFFKLLAPEEGDVVEVRVFEPYVMSGYFNNLVPFLAAAAERDGKGDGVFCTINPVNPALFARSPNALVSTKTTVRNEDILRRRLLLIDLDPERPTKTSSSDAQHEAAFQLATKIRGDLVREGWPEPLCIDSGNGAHLYFRVDLPADDGGLIQRVLLGFAARYDTSVVKVDKLVHNPSRIAKIPGTLACKGKNTPERPHRRSRIISAPEALALVTREQLEAVAAPAKAPKKSAGGAKQGRRSFGQRLDVPAYLTGRGFQDFRAKEKGVWTWYNFVNCPVHDDHDGHTYECGIAQHADGAMTAKCQHNDALKWEAFKSAIGDPGPFLVPIAGAPTAGAAEHQVPGPEALDGLRKALERLPAEAVTYRWLGSIAAHCGDAAVQGARAALPDDEARKAFDDGAAAQARGDRVAHPPDENARRAAKRAIAAFATPRRTGPEAEEEEAAGPPPLEILEIVRRTHGEGHGGRVDIVVGTSRGKARLSGVDGRTLTNFAAIRALAVEEGLVLPVFKGERAGWISLLEEAFARAKVETPAPDEDVGDAIRQAIVGLLRDGKRGESLADLNAGRVIQHGDRLLVKPKMLIAEVVRALPGDQVSRAQVVHAARLLGMDEGYRPEIDGKRSRAWAFPPSVTGAEGEGAQP